MSALSTVFRGPHHSQLAVRCNTTYWVRAIKTSTSALSTVLTGFTLTFMLRVFNYGRGKILVKIVKLLHLQSVPNVMKLKIITGELSYLGLLYNIINLVSYTVLNNLKTILITNLIVSCSYFLTVNSYVK